MDREIVRAEGHRRFVLVRTGSVRCALPASDVVRVVRHLRCYAVPGSQSHFIGLAQYGGDPLPVLDLHTLVEGGAPSTRHQATVILGSGRRRRRSVLGLAVDEVLQVVELPEGNVGAPGAALVADTVEIGGRTVKVVNTGQLLSEKRQDSGAMND